MPDKLVVFYNGTAIVIIEPVEFTTMTSVLDWYAQKYGFERHALTGAWLPTVTSSDEADPGTPSDQYQASPLN